MKIKLLTIIGLLMIFIVPSIYGFGRITSPEEALSKELGMIHLIGESHSLGQDIEQKKLLYKLANEGNVILGLEGLSEEVGREFDARIFGLEEDSLHKVVTTFQCLMNLFRHIQYKKFVVFSGSSSDDNEYEYDDKYEDVVDASSYVMQLTLKRIWDYVDEIYNNNDSLEKEFFWAQQNQSRLLKHLIESMQENLESTLDGSGSIYKHVGTNSINDNFYDNLSSDSSEWFALLKQVAQYLIRKSADKGSTKSLNDVLVELNNLYEEMEIGNDSLSINEIVDRSDIIDDRISDLTMNVRNEVFLGNICRAYNEKKYLKPFFIIVGKRHVAFLKRNLIAASFAVAVNDGVYDYEAKLEL